MLWNFFQKITAQANDFYHSSQIEEFFVWLHSSTTSNDKELVFLNLPLQQELIDSQTRKRVPHESKSKVAFVVCEPRQLISSLKILNHAVNEKSWHLIFYATGIEIWESALRYGETLPVRFGIRGKEKDKLLSFARECMKKFFKDTSMDKTEHATPAVSKGEEKVSVDVALWINGNLRGSIIIENKPLYEGIKRASLGALRDRRMKPVELHELAQALIEITILSDLKLPLRKEDLCDSNIDGRKGYYVARGEKHGWYLPAVFNCLKFRGMAHMRESLIQEKAKISRDVTEDVSLYAFMVEGFMEGGSDKVLLLDGAVAFDETGTENFSPLFIEEVQARGDRAAEWLLSMQDEDGYIPLYANPLRSSFGRMDWARLACSVHALSCYGKVTGNEQFLKGARKTFSYLLRYLLEVPPVPVNGRVAALVYLARAAMALKKDSTLRDIMSQVLSCWQNPSYQPILAANMATLFALQARDNWTLLQESTALAEQVFADFKTKLGAKRHIQLAEYPELIHVLELLHQLTGKDIYTKKAKQVKEWFLVEQFGNGAFPSRVGSSFAYSRGTGKIFEALAGTPTGYEKALESSFHWLARMQYGKHNTYFVLPAFRDRIHGGLRHDHTNPEAWIDGAAHFLLGISRLVSGMHDPEI